MVYGTSNGPQNNIPAVCGLHCPRSLLTTSQLLFFERTDSSRGAKCQGFLEDVRKRNPVAYTTRNMSYSLNSKGGLYRDYIGVSL